MWGEACAWDVRNCALQKLISAACIRDLVLLVMTQNLTYTTLLHTTLQTLQTYRLKLCNFMEHLTNLNVLVRSKKMF